MEPEARPATTCCRNWVNSISEVGVADGLVLGQLGARPLERHVPHLEDVSTARGAQRELRVLLDDEDGETLLLVQVAENPEDLPHDDRREPERRLVEEEETRPRHQRSGNREHLLLPAGERSGLLSAATLDPGEVAAHALVDLGEPAAVEIGAEAKVLVNRELPEDAAAFGDVRNSGACDPLGRGARDALAREPDPPRSRDETGGRAGG